jgi:hypothetical protein
MSEFFFLFFLQGQCTLINVSVKVTVLASWLFKKNISTHYTLQQDTAGVVNLSHSDFTWCLYAFHTW